MNQDAWLKRRAECKTAVHEKPSKYILVTCRDLEVAEKRILGKNFQQVHVYNSALDHGFDLSKLAFDLMVIDASRPENHTFLEMIAPSCASLNIPIIVLKQPLSNYKKLAEDLQAFVIGVVEDLEGPNFFLFLMKTKLRKLESRWLTVLKRLFRMLF